MSGISEVLRLGRNITLFPVIHGSGDYAVEVRRLMLTQQFDCLAVPLPPSFASRVEEAVEQLPTVSVVLQKEQLTSFESGEGGGSGSPTARATYVPIDPCQPVIAALRIARQEHIRRAYIDPESDYYRPRTAVLPDPYALKQVPTEKFASAVLPAIQPPEDEEQQQRIFWMANRLHELSKTHSNVLCVISLVDWPWLRDAFNSAVDCPPEVSGPAEPCQIFSLDPRTLLFVLGELPFITAMYELARVRLDDDENLSVDGIKALLLYARERYKAEFGNRARRITPHLLKTLLKYVRNLRLIERRFTPDLYTLVVASQQIAGDQFAMHIAEAAREYAFPPLEFYPQARFGIDRMMLPDGTEYVPINRLPGHPVVWRSCQLKSRPDLRRQIEWKRTWNPYGQCSWPPEDVAIERFRTHVKDVALEMLGNDLARTEKFSSSIMDGIDMRETLRNWHTGDLFVKVFPPARGKLDCVVMLFDSPADPRQYPWRITWHAESHDESTLSLFATNFLENMVGPGIALARYGGCMFLFPPRPIPDIWRDPEFDFVDTLEERLLAAACVYSRERHIALLSHSPPGAGWRRLAARHGKKIVHVPLNRFGNATIEKLRMFHVLNGHSIRSFAGHFIRKP